MLLLYNTERTGLLEKHFETNSSYTTVRLSSEEKRKARAGQETSGGGITDAFL